MGDLMDMRWLVRDINARAVDEVRIQHIFTPGLPDEIRREKIRRRKFAKAESHIPFYFLLDISYISASFLSVLVSLIYFLMFFTLLGWTPAIQSFAGDVTTQVGNKEHFHDMVEANGYHMRTWAGYYLFMSMILFSVSWFSYFGAGIVGRRSIYIISLVSHFVILVFEIFAVIYAFIYLPTKCDTTVFRVHMTNYFIWFGILSPHIKNHGHEAMDKIDVLQASLSCCGIDNYKDYEKIFAARGDPEFDPSWYPEEIFVLETHSIHDLEYYFTNGREVRQLPHSCCTPFWRQNVYCADDIFLMERNSESSTVAKDRLNPRGCVEVVGETCELLVYLATYGMLGIVCFRIFLFIVMLVVTGVTLRSMQLVMTTLFSVTRGNVRFIYDYRKTRPEEDPYKRALGDFRRGVVPEGWEEFVQNRIEGRKGAFPISEQFTMGQLVDNSAIEDKMYEDIIRKWRGPKAMEEGKPIYFGIKGSQDMKESDFLAIRGKEKEFRQTNNIFTRLAKIGVDSRRKEAEDRKDIKAYRAAMQRKKKVSEGLIELHVRLPPAPPSEPPKKEEPKKIFKDEVIVEIPKDRSPVDKLILEKQNRTTEKGRWKEKFRKSIGSVMALQAEERDRIEKILNKDSQQAAPIAESRAAKAIDATQRPTSAPPSRALPPKVTPPQPPSEEKEKAPHEHDHGKHRSKVKNSKPRKPSVSEIQVQERSKTDDKVLKANKPKLEDVQQKIVEKVAEKKEKEEPIKKKRLSSDRPSKKRKSKVRTYDPYELPTELDTKKKTEKPKKVTSGKAETEQNPEASTSERHKQNPRKENEPAPKKKKASLQVATVSNKKKKKRRRKRKMIAIKDRKPWNYGLQRRPKQVYLY